MSLRRQRAAAGGSGRGRGASVLARVLRAFGVARARAGGRNGPRVQGSRRRRTFDDRPHASFERRKKNREGERGAELAICTRVAETACCGLKSVY